MSEVVEPDILQPGPGPHGPPGMIKAAGAEAPVPVVARKHPGAVLPSRQGFEQPDRRRRELHGAGSGLGVSEMNLAGVEIDVPTSAGSVFRSCGSR